MFQNLSDRLESVFRTLRGKGLLREDDIRDALRELRRALLEADVQVGVARDFVERVRKQVLGEQALDRFNAAQQVLSVVHREMVRLLGEEPRDLRLRSVPVSVVMLVGLHGVGKTSFAARLGGLLADRGRRPLLAALDVQRPAAVDQLEVLGNRLDIPIHADRAGKDVLAIARAARAKARETLRDTLILDTAGRLHLDDDLMAELVGLRELTQPDEILLVLDAMTGQEAVRIAMDFRERLPLTGLLLSKLDGDARGGAALSVSAVTDLPVYFSGTGEGVRDIEPFDPQRLAGRIMGMGDLQGLAERVQAAQDVDADGATLKRLRKQDLGMDDLLGQIRSLRKMGPLNKVMGMIPGAAKLLGPGAELDEKPLVRTEAMILSMTRQERRRPQIINGSRRKRIARGSGTTVQDVNRLLKQYAEMKKMMKTMSRLKGSGKVPDFLRSGK